MAKKSTQSKTPEPEPTPAPTTIAREPAPSAAPSALEAEAQAETPETPDDPAAQQAGIESFLEDEADDLDPVVEAEPPEGQTPAEPVPAETPPAEAPPVVAEAPPAEPKPGEVPAAPAPVEAKPEPSPPLPAPAAAPAEPPTPAPTMEQIRESYQKNRSDMEANVATTVYNLSEDQVQRLDDGDAALIPELMAKVYMDAVTGAVAHMITHLPNMMESVLTGRDGAKVLEDQFYTSNPNINRVEHAETVSRFGLAYRNLYPNAPAEDFIRDVGAQVMVALQISPSGQPAPEPPAPRTPPFQPAAAGGGKGAAPSPTNPFEVLSDEMAAEDLDLD